MSSPANHYVLLGDLVRSRRIQDRSAVAEDIETALQDMHRGWLPEDAWFAPPVTVKGMDEIAGVLSRPQYAFDFLTYMNQLIWPHRIRVAVARGPIDIGLDGDHVDVAALDGPAFHLAAQGMARAKSQDLPFVLEGVGESGVWDPAARNLIESSARVHAALMAEWTETSRQRVMDLLRSTMRVAGSRPKTQRELAAAARVSEQAYSASLKHAHEKELRLLQDSIRRFLEVWTA